MLDERQLDQLIEETGRQPGSPSFALLAEHYLDVGAADAALEVCRRGFAANPGYERGVLVYLATLLRVNDLTTALQVYDQAAQENPRSARLLAMGALVHSKRAGSDEEALQLARKACELDPMSRLAWGVMAMVELKGVSGGVPVPPPAAPLTANELTVIVEGLRLDEATPVVERPEEAQGPEPKGASPEEAMPVPTNTEIDSVVEALRTLPPDSRPKPSAPPSRLVRSPASRAAVPPKAPARPSAKPAAKPVAKVPVAKVPAPAAAKPATPVEPAAPAEPAKLAAPAAKPPAAPVAPAAPKAVAPPATRPPAPAGPKAAAKPPSAAPPAPPVPEEPAPPEGPVVWLAAEQPGEYPPADPARLEITARLPSIKQRWMMWTAVAAATLALAAIVLLSRQRGEVEVSLEPALTGTLPDRLGDYLRARATLEQSLRGRDHAGLRGALALVEAHLSTRFHVVERKQVDARLAKADTGPLGGLARALLHLHDGQIPQAAQVVRGIPADAGGWHRRYVALRLAVDEGRLQSAGQVLTTELQQRRPSPAVLLLGARLNRLRGDAAASLRLLEAGTRVWPEHPGLRIERALLAAEGGTTPGGAAMKALQRDAGDIPRYRARLALLEGYAAWSAKRAGEAIAAADRARAMDPRDPEAAWQAVAWRVMSRQSVREAADLMDAAVPQMQIYQPDAGLWQVQALLLLHRPRQARLALGKTPEARLTGASRRWLKALQVDVARQLGEIPLLCGADNRGGLRQRVACAEALVERSQLEPTRKVIDRISHPGARAYLLGLQALAEGDLSGAIRRLHDAKQLPDPVAPLLALATAHQRRNELPDAVAALRRALALEPASVGVRLALARGLAAAGHVTEARVHLARVLADKPTAVGTLVDQGQTWLDLGGVDKARTVAGMASTHHPQSPAVQILAGRVALADGEPKRARQLFAAAFQKDASRVVALAEMARAAVALGDSARAQADLDRALKLRPDAPEVLLGVARAYLEMGRFREAHDTGARGVWLWREKKRQWRSTRAMLELGRRLRKGDDWARARGKELLFEACIVKGAPAVAFLELGRVYREEDDRPRAIWCYRRAIALDPELAEAHHQLAKVLEDPRQAERARQRYQELESRDRAQ